MKKNILNRTDRAQCATHVTKNPCEGNYVEKKRFDRLADCHNALVRYVGAPYTVCPDKLTPFPATLGEYGTPVKGYAGYRLDLTPYAGKFRYVHFRGKGNGKDVICGCIIDKEGRVESFKALPDADGWAILPLTESSIALHASMPMRKGKCLWKNIKVGLLSGGMCEFYSYAIKELSNRLAVVEETLRTSPVIVRGNISVALC